MGIDVDQLRLLMLGRAMGVSLEKTLTVGRLDVFTTPAEIAETFARFGIEITAEKASLLSKGDNGYSEPIIRELGAKSVDSLDVSDLDGATILHDLNEKVPPELEKQFSLVLDGGTLEHVFDFPTALKTCMSLPRVGGHLILTTPANNLMGHGFWQVSPELLFRALCAENGYRVEALFLSVLFANRDFLAVRDPAIVGRRIGWNGSPGPIQCFVIAKRVADCPLFVRAPQQSDYAAQWASPDQSLQERTAKLPFRFHQSERPPSLRQRLKSIIRRRLPRRALAVIRALRRHPVAHPSSDAFLRINPSPAAIPLLESFYGASARCLG